MNTLQTMSLVELLDGIKYCEKIKDHISRDLLLEILNSNEKVNWEEHVFDETLVNSQKDLDKIVS